MSDLYLRFASEQEAEPFLYDIVDVDGALEKQPKYLNTDVLGVLYNVDNTDPENPVYTPIDGWYVNLRVGDYDPALDAFRVNPEPMVWRRVWG
jgi:hypothetical protein